MNFLTHFEKWMDGAACATTDPEMFYPEKGGVGARDAKSVCLRCDVRTQCLEYALSNKEPFGVWGGKSEQERRKMLSRQVAA